MKPITKQHRNQHITLEMLHKLNCHKISIEITSYIYRKIIWQAKKNVSQTNTQTPSKWKQMMPTARCRINERDIIESTEPTRIRTALTQPITTTTEHQLPLLETERQKNMFPVDESAHASDSQCVLVSMCLWIGILNCILISLACVLPWVGVYCIGYATGIRVCVCVRARYKQRQFIHLSVC